MARVADRATRAPCAVSERIDDGEESFDGERDDVVGGRDEQAPERHLGEPESTECLIRPAACSPCPLVILHTQPHTQIVVHGRAFQFAIQIDSIRYANRLESIRFV